MGSRIALDRFARRVCRASAVACVLLVAAIAAGLYVKARPVLAAHPLREILFSLEWQPQAGRFGLFAFLCGTVAVAVVAMALSVPVSLLAAIYLAEYAPPAMRRWALPVVDLLSGIPSVIYGVWGVLVVVPAVERLAATLGGSAGGYCLLSGGVVLAVMVSPFILHVAREVLAAVPSGLREASLALGATRWQTVKRVVLRRSLPGVAAAVVLGLARALGETIAVLMVVGNVPAVPRSLFDPVYPLPALLANQYGEMMSVPLYDSALLLAALVLLAVVMLFNVLAKAILVFVQRGEGVP